MMCVCRHRVPSLGPKLSPPKCGRRESGTEAIVYQALPSLLTLEPRSKTTLSLMSQLQMWKNWRGSGESSIQALCQHTVQRGPITLQYIVTRHLHHCFANDMSTESQDFIATTSENIWMPVIEYCDLYLSYSALSTAKLQNLSAQLLWEFATYTLIQKRWRILVQLLGLQCWEWLENMLIAEMRRRGDQTLEDSTAMLEIQ